MLKKLLAFLLVFAMLISLCACGGKDAATQGDPKADPSAVPANEAMVSPDDPAAVADGVGVYVGPFTLDGEAELSVKKLPDETDAEAGWKIEPYEISVGDLHELGDYATVFIPYDGADFCDAGEDIAKCVGAKYKNPETGEWEDVLFTVDTAAQQINILTDHFSEFGVFYVKNEGLRKAYITDVRDDIDYLSYEQAAAAMSSFVSAGGDETPETVKAGVAALGSITDLAEYYGDLSDAAENVVNVLSLGETEFDELLSDKASDLLGSVGTLASGIKMAKQILSDDASDKLDLYKDVVSTLIESGGEALTSAGGAAFGLALSGVWVFDKVISTMFEEAESIKMEQIGEVYEYYNDQYSGGGYAARTLKQWRQIMIDIVRENPDDEAAVKAALEAEIDAYAKAFWNIGGDTLAEVEDDAGFKRMPFPTQSEMDELTEQYKQNLYVRLQPVTTSVQNYFLNNAKAEYLKSLSELKKFYNQTVSFTAKEEFPEGAEPMYAGYTCGFGPLGGSANAADWVGATVRENGEVKTSFTLLGFLMAGSPAEFRLWAPGDDPVAAEPALSVPFTITLPATEVAFSGGPTLEELVGEYTGTVSLTSFRISDEGYQLYASEAEDELMTQAECDEALNEMVAEGEMGVGQSLHLLSSDPASGECVLVMTLESDDSTPISAPATYAGGVLTVDCADGTTATVTVTETDSGITIAGENIVAGVSDEEYGDAVLFYIGTGFVVSK